MVCGLEAPPIAVWLHQIIDPSCRKALGDNNDSLRRLFVLYNMGIPLEGGLVESVLQDADWGELERSEQAIILFMLMGNEGKIPESSTLMESINASIRNDDDSNGDIPDMNLTSNPLWESWDDDGNADGL